MKQTSSRFDKRIIILYTTVIIISGLVILYKYKTTKECPEIVFTISQSNIDEGELVQFSNHTKDTESVKWDFGDNSSQVNEMNPTHTYQSAGEYMLKLTVNDQCQEVRKIIVNPKKVIVNDKLIPKFTCPEYVTIGNSVKFICLTKNYKSLEWRFGETGKIDSRIESPNFKYTIPGPKTVSLIVNGNYNYIAKRIIYVMAPEAPKVDKSPAKPAPKPVQHIPQAPEEYASYDEMKTAPPKEKEKEKILNDDELMAALNNYSKGKAKISQIVFSCCEKIESVPVVINDKPTNLSLFLEKIKDRPIVINKIRVLREKNGCISQIIIKYKSN